ncbi:hypothetical protein GCM10022225_72540 [Plantactinospora mayteni]|uniref:Uncharacterized protein n=1 Tax=Plantactinospora mayteni TaxID=566021 RepID=A0ABQ4F1C3_9ACTN|nr:hypothetical protein [Plantactinospora mayteni]GIH00709.1 hypothetical protein Pma05_72810 [Plantactinospora mayteni]
MLAEHVRDAAMTAVIFGFFASSWFGWAQEAPPPRWRKPLIAGSVGSLLVAVAGGLLAWQDWSTGSVFDSAETARNFGILVGIEFGLAGLGAGLLSIRKRGRELVSAWIALVVGVHFFPLAEMINFPLVHVAGVLVTLAALVAVPVARKRALRVSAVTGLGTGAGLLVAAVAALAIALFGY